jgi:exodeoxyribonuclease V alpha subunit
MPAAIKAEVQTVVYHNPDNGYAVVRVRAKDEPGIVTVVGCLGQLQPGEFLEIEGEWKTHPKFGRQLEASHFKQTYPATEHGVVRFLKSSLKGVGEKPAEALVKQFGVAVLDILDTDPERLRARLKAITKKAELWRHGGRHWRHPARGLELDRVPAQPRGSAHLCLAHFQALRRARARRSLAPLETRLRSLALSPFGVFAAFAAADAMALKLGFARGDAPTPRKRLLWPTCSSPRASGAGTCFCPKEQLSPRVLADAGLDDLAL